MVEEVVRGLDHRHALVVEVADQRVERVGHRHVVGVEHQHQVALGPRQRRVEVAGLGVGVVGAGQVAGAGQPRQLLHLRPAAVVEQPGRVGIGERAAACQRRHHHLDRLVVGADVDVDRASRRRRRPHRRRPRPGEPGQDCQRVEPVELGHQQHREEDGTRPFAAPADPPGQVADPPEQRHQRHRAQQERMAIEESPPPGLLAAAHAASSARTPGSLGVKHVRCRGKDGGGGIRTHERLATPTVFETAPFNRSGTPPGQIHDEILGDFAG